MHSLLGPEAVRKQGGRTGCKMGAAEVLCRGAGPGDSLSCSAAGLPRTNSTPRAEMNKESCGEACGEEEKALPEIYESPRASKDRFSSISTGDPGAGRDRACCCRGQRKQRGQTWPQT